MRALVETQALIGEPGARRLAKPLETVQVPGSVQAVLAARIDRLTPAAKHVLQSASVIGKDVPFPVLAEIADLPDEGLRAGLALLQSGELLYEAQLLPRDRVHVQARADPRGGLRQPAPRDAAHAARAHRGRHRAALRRTPGRARGAAGPPRPARRPARAGGRLPPPGGGEGGRPLGAPRGGGFLRAGPRDPRVRRAAGPGPRHRGGRGVRPPRFPGAARRVHADPRPPAPGRGRTPRRSATAGASGGSRPTSPSRTTRSAIRPPRSAPPSRPRRWDARCRTARC